MPPLKKHVFYLDFIRAVATIIIVLTHFNAIFIFSDPPLLNKLIFPSKIFNIYIGDFGVSLFLIVSSASLMFSYDDELEIKRYLKRRCLSIYPMFYLCYITVFLIDFYVNGWINRSVSPWKFVYTIIGMDGLLSFVTPTFYIIGEWFLGFILIFYIIFPVLRYCFHKYEKLTLICTGILFILGLYLSRYSLMPEPTNLLIRLPELVFGMLFVKRIKFSSKWLIILASIILFGNALTKPYIDTNIQTTYIGISSFIIISFFAGHLENRIEGIVKVICRYSYPIFLVHHWIIIRISQRFDLSYINKLETWLLLAICLILIIISSKLLDTINKSILAALRKKYRE